MQETAERKEELRALYPIIKDLIINLKVKKIVFNGILIPTLTYELETGNVTKKRKEN